MSTIRIYAVRLEGYPAEESITAYQFKINDGQLQAADKKSLVDFIIEGTHLVYVGNTNTRVEVADGRYLRSDSNGTTRDNLLNLPRF